MDKQSKQLLEVAIVVPAGAIATWLISVPLHSLIRHSEQPGRLTNEISAVCLMVAVTCIVSVAIVEMVRAINRRDDPRCVKPPDHSPDPPTDSN